MRDDYLWDRSGEPDEEIERLEAMLGQLRSKQPAAEWPARSKVREFPGGRWWSERRWVASVAASLALLISASWLATRPIQVGWNVERVDGAPVIGSRPMHATGQLSVGDWLVTDARSRARIDVGTIGEVQVEPNSRLRLLRARPADSRLALERGTMHALISAPPRMFSVETPSAVAVDLGCEYTLTVDADGTSTLRVSLGWVGFEQNGLESWVPMGAEAVTRRGALPGTPYFVDASATFRNALARLDFDRDPAALDIVLAEARPQDALTLWHLLPKLHGDAQSRVYDRFAALVPPPAGVTREGILRNDRRMFDQWWDKLDLGDSSWWRIWKGPSPFDTK